METTSRIPTTDNTIDDYEQARTIFCANLSEKVSEALLYELFLQGGPLDRVFIPKDKQGRQRSFAFITYTHIVSVPYAMFLFNGTKLFSRELNMKAKNPNRPGSQQQNVSNNSSPPSPISNNSTKKQRTENGPVNNTDKYPQNNRNNESSTKHKNPFDICMTSHEARKQFDQQNDKNPPKDSSSLRHGNINHSSGQCNSMLPTMRTSHKQPDTSKKPSNPYDLNVLMRLSGHILQPKNATAAISQKSSSSAASSSAKNNPFKVQSQQPKSGSIFGQIPDLKLRTCSSTASTRSQEASSRGAGSSSDRNYAEKRPRDRDQNPNYKRRR